MLVINSSIFRANMGSQDSLSIDIQAAVPRHWAAVVVRDHVDHALALDKEGHVSEAFSGREIVRAVPGVRNN